MRGRCDAVLEALSGSADGQPALRLLERALTMAHTITASKLPVALAYPRQMSRFMTFLSYLY